MNGVHWHFGKLPRNKFDTLICLFVIDRLQFVRLPAKTDDNKRKRHAFFNFASPCKIQGKFFYCTIDNNFDYRKYGDIKYFYEDALFWASCNISDAGIVSFFAGRFLDWLLIAKDIDRTFWDDYNEE